MTTDTTRTASAKRAPLSLASVRLCSSPNSPTPTASTRSFDMMQVLPDRTICWYSSRANKKPRTPEQLAALEKGTAGNYNGQMSRATKSKCNKLLQNWMQVLQYHIDKYQRNRKRAKYWPVFVTLTLSDKQRHSDQHIKRHFLGNFIGQIKRTYFVEHYFWRAEAQKNGNIHFHLIIDKFIPKENLTSIWNGIQHEYVTTYTQRTGKTNPPSTQIEGIRNFKRISLYATKYALKDDGDEPARKIEGRIWGCSDQLRCIQPYISNKLDEDRSTLETELAQIEHLPLENYNVEQSHIWIKLSPKAWDSLDILQSTLTDHYRKQYLKLYIEHEYQDVTRTLHLQDAKKELIRQALEFDKATNNARKRHTIQKTVSKPSRHPIINRSANNRQLTIRQHLVKAARI